MANTIEEILKVKRRNKTEEKIYETYKRELCTQCKNKDNDKDLCDIRVNIKNEAQCVNYERCMKNKCKTCKDNEKCNMWYYSKNIKYKMYKGDDDTVSQRAFKTREEFINKIKEYVQVCKSKQELPNVAGFCVYCDINRDTFYAQEEYYSDTYKKANDILEDATINSKDVNDTFKIFYMKNKFGYKDKQDVDANVNTEIKVTLIDD